MRHDPYLADACRSIRRGDIWDGVTIHEYCECVFCTTNKGKKMNETTADRLEAASATGFNTEFNGAAMKAALEAATVTEVTKPLTSEQPATMEFQSETAPWEAVQTEADINP